MLARDLSGDLRLEIDRGGNSRIAFAGAVAIDSDRTNLSVGLAKLQSTSAAGHRATSTAAGHNSRFKPIVDR